jgi:hypothetical protein
VLVLSNNSDVLLHWWRTFVLGETPRIWETAKYEPLE